MISTCTKWVENKFSGFNFLINLYSIYYKNIVKQEVQLADIQEKDRVLCIGGGSIPSTAIEIVNQTNAFVDVIDTDNKAVHQARSVIHRLGLDNKIKVIRKDGQNVDLNPYDVVHIALQVSPKEKVAKHIWNNLIYGNRVVIRMPKKFLRFFYSNISDEFTINNSKYISNCYLSNRANTMEKVLIMVKN